MYERPGYDARADFAPVIVLLEAPLPLAVPAASAVRMVSDLVTLAKATPGKLSYGSPGIATPPHLAVELFNRAAGIDVVHVPYKGATPAIQDLVGGRLAGLCHRQHRIAAVAGRRRQAARDRHQRPGASREPARHPDLHRGRPAGRHLCQLDGRGRPGRHAGTADRALPNRELARALATDPAKAWFRGQGATVLGGTSADFARRIEADHKRWGDVIRSAGIKAE